MHLAAAVQTPCVAIFAARNKPRVWFPYGEQHRVIYHQTECWGCGLETCIVEKKRCLTSIAVEEVLGEVRAVLGDSLQKKMDGRDGVFAGVFEKNGS
jgi:ADP-heptose:LPS heptosyltransferase